MRLIDFIGNAKSIINHYLHVRVSFTLVTQYVRHLKSLTFTSKKNDNLLVRLGIITKLNSFLVLRVGIIIPRSLDNCLWRISFLFVTYHVLEYILHLYYICASTKIGALHIRQSELLPYFQCAWKQYWYQSFQLVY